MKDAHQTPAIGLDHVSKAFGHREVLNDISLRVDSGTAYCLLGRSGTGKSVTLKIMVGLIQPERGRVLINGAEVQNREASQLVEGRKQVGFLFQNAALFDSVSVAENVAFPLRRHTRKSAAEIQEIVAEKLREVELEGEGAKMPSELSGGMLKRAGLARALALDPSILLADEPSSGLDHITAHEINSLLLQLKNRRHVSIVVVTHDVAGARSFADRYAVLDRGRLVASGAADEMDRSENDLVRELMQGAEV